MKVFRWLTLWLLLVVVIGTTAGQRCWNYYRLSKRGIALQGVAGNRQPHGQIAYSFLLNGQVYRGVGFAGGSDVAEGDPVTVVYLSETPEINCLGNPRELYSNDFPLVLIVSFLFPTLIVLMIAYRWTKRAKLTKRQAGIQE